MHYKTRSSGLRSATEVRLLQVGAPVESKQVWAVSISKDQFQGGRSTEKVAYAGSKYRRRYRHTVRIG
jgi:hypothetical protein